MSTIAWRPAQMLGRLANGFQSDQGSLVHAVALLKCKRPPCPFNDFGRKEIPNDDFSAQLGLCRARPGRRSVGWTFLEPGTEITCPRCKKRIARIEERAQQAAIDFIVNGRD